MAIEEIFTEPAVEQPEPQPEGRRRRIVVLSVAITLIALLVALTTWYLRTGKPLSQLPGLGQNGQPPHYLFSVYGVNKPLGVAVSPDGDRIYVSESTGDRVVKVFDRTGAAKGTLKPPADSGTNHAPVYIAVNPRTQDVYVSDRTTAAIYVYGRDGAYRRTFRPKGDLGAQWAPLGVAFDSYGRLYVTDVRSTGAHRLLVLTPDGALERSVGESAGLTFPNGVAVDSRGVVSVADSNNSRVLMFDRDGKPGGRLVSESGDTALGIPRGVAVDDSNRLYVVDLANHAVRIYKIADAVTGTPQYMASFGTEGTGDGAFEYPNGVAADSRARLYITDRENNRLQVWSY
ncbi:MAG TPA: SMP-30/gluconolactonase/LRE family protein [Kineosporiaceae bacterium]|nr:SMP-30/gluconolactonase/LRE family protein [Kineosporiaceae bacterium]